MEASKIYVEFYRSTRLNAEKSAEEGREIHDEIDMIMKKAPGRTANIIRREVRSPARATCRTANAVLDDTRDFPLQWSQYQQGLTQQSVSGTPLSVCTAISMGQAKELESQGVHTLEQLVEARSDVNVMGISELKKAASKILGTSGTRELEKQQGKIDALEAKLEQLIGVATEAPDPELEGDPDPIVDKEPVVITPKRRKKEA